jgi:cell division septation protein DedD
MLASLLSVGAAIDVLIAVAMLSFLFTRKKKALDRYVSQTRLWR